MTNIITTFYQSFKSLDAESMVKCYHENITFEDPAFGVLKGERARNMWRMLIASQRDKSFEVYFDSVELSNTSAKAHWEAQYNFSKTGRRVHNSIEAEFILKDGLIFRHTDNFNLHKWAIQALGWKGLIIGWTAFFKHKLQTQTNGLLLEFERKKAEEL